MKEPGALEAEAKASNLWLSGGTVGVEKTYLLRSSRDALPGAGVVGSAVVTACRGAVGFQHPARAARRDANQAAPPSAPKSVVRGTGRGMQRLGMEDGWGSASSLGPRG